MALGVKIRDESLQLRVILSEVHFGDRSHSETTVGVRSWYARNPREPASLGGTREGLAKRSFFAF